MSDEIFMSLAIKKALKGVKKGQAPFGACIIKNNKVISCEHSTVLKDTNIISHAEMNAIKKACKKLKSINLKDCIIYSTVEPCPMCFSAIHWAKISKIIYGASENDAKKAGFNELMIHDKKLKNLGRLKIKIVSNFMKKECLEPFKAWKKRKNKRIY